MTSGGVLDEPSTEFPHGALGVFRPIVISVAPEHQAELTAIIDWKAGRIGMMDLMSRLEALQQKRSDVLVEP